jgi:hypothetical protein
MIIKNTRKYKSAAKISPGIVFLTIVRNKTEIFAALLYFLVFFADPFFCSKMSAELKLEFQSS